MNTLIQFIKSVLEISLFASAMIVIVLLIRKLAKDRIDIRAVSFLWLLVILRLCLPGMLESPVHFAGLFPEAAVSQDAAGQPVSPNAGIRYEENSAPGSQLSGYGPSARIKDTTPGNAAAAGPQDFPFYEQALSFVKSPDIWLLAAILWIIGGLAVLASVLKESIQFNLRILKGGYPLTDRKIRDIIAAHKKAVRLRRAVRVSFCSSIQMPMAVGAFRPHILLPPHLTEELNEEHVNAILLHEV